MAKPEVLSRVDADLARGDLRTATRRLSSLIAADPQDLELRARLADVYRGAGNLSEAGRWGFLTEDAEPHEIEAYAQQHRAAADRLRLLRLRGENPRALGPLAGPRYADLAARAATETVLPRVRPPKNDVVPPLARPPENDAVPRPAPARVAPEPSLSWSCMDLFTAIAVFGPAIVVVCVIVYEIVTAVFPALNP